MTPSGKSASSQRTGEPLNSAGMVFCWPRKTGRAIAFALIANASKRLNAGRCARSIHQMIPAISVSIYAFPVRGTP